MKINYEIKRIFKHVVGVVIIIFVVVICLFYFFLPSYTKHGESITVPDLRGFPIDKLEAFLKDKDLKYIIEDSTYIPNKPKGTVISQDPRPNSKVKQARVVRITINSVQPPQVSMPNLKDVSLRQARLILESYGLKAGKLEYVPDLARNAVLKQKYGGREIKPGEKIFKGSAIDLELGDGLGNIKVTIPNLVGLPFDEALFVIQGSSLNVGAITYDAKKKDMEGKIFKQYPEYSEKDSINQGSPIDIFVGGKKPEKEEGTNE